MISAQYLKNYFTHPHQLEQRDKTKTTFELGDLDLFFKATEVIQVDDICRMVSAQYLKKYLTFPHQMWDKEAPGHDKDQVRTG